MMVPLAFRTALRSICPITRPVLVSLIPVILLLSCHYPPRVEDLEASVGTLTQPEMIRQFGYPQRLKRVPPGNTEIWEYEFLAGDSRCIGYRVYFDEQQRSQRWERIACR
jgi:hypothetical protein